METFETTNPTTAATAVAYPTGNVATMEDRCQAVQRMASEAAVRQPDWVAFFREVLGADGIVRKMFPSTEDLTAFEKTAEYAAIQQMVVKLREKGPSEDDSTEPTRVITVRLPKSLHEALKAEAHLHQTSMNQLCISKLVQLIDKDFVPGE